MYNILFVDDEPIVKITIQKMIPWQETDFTISGTANNGISALKYVRRHPVDAVITDLQMPGMNGVEFITALRQEGFTGPILALSNYSDFELVRGALTAGAFDYLLKISLDRENLLRLLERMRELIESSRQEEEDAQRTEQLIESQRYDLAVSSFVNYLLNSREEESAPVLPELRLEELLPASCCTVRLEKERIADSESVQFLLAVAQQIFEDIGSRLFVRLHRNELFCLIGEKELAEQGRKLSVKLRRFEKQVETFSSAAPLITWIEHVSSLSGIRRACQICTGSYERTFYKDFVSPLRIVPGGSTENWDEFHSGFMVGMTDLLRQTDYASAEKAILRFVDECAEKRISPSILKEAVINAVWHAYDLNRPTSPLHVINQVVQEIRQCEDVDALKNEIGSFFRYYTGFSIPYKESYRRETREVIDYLESHYREKLALGAIADHVNLSREYLCRLFKTDTGMSIFQCLADIRMRKAGRLLLSDPNILMKEVALSVGIDNIHFFSRKFKDFFGVAPSQYYESINGEAAEAEGAPESPLPAPAPFPEDLSGGGDS